MVMQISIPGKLKIYHCDIMAKQHLLCHVITNIFKISKIRNLIGLHELSNPATDPNRLELDGVMPEINNLLLFVIF